MTRRNKLLKFSEILEFPNVLENYNYKDDYLTTGPDTQVKMKGRWKDRFFKNDHPLTLELACGRGEYTNALAQDYPERNFLGLDIKGARIWKGAKIALEQELNNVGYLRTKIEMIENFFEQGEVDEIWITFPDPFLKDRNINRRLTAPPFLDRYNKVLKDGGTIHLKTDDPTLYEYTLETLAGRADYTITYYNDDIYAGDLIIPELNYKTYYEKKHLDRGRRIKYVQIVSEERR